jgi:hypothetical protein
MFNSLFSKDNTHVWEVVLFFDVPKKLAQASQRSAQRLQKKFPDKTQGLQFQAHETLIVAWHRQPTYTRVSSNKPILFLFSV